MAESRPAVSALVFVDEEHKAFQMDIRSPKWYRLTKAQASTIKYQQQGSHQYGVEVPVLIVTRAFQQAMNFLRREDGRQERQFGFRCPCPFGHKSVRISSAAVQAELPHDGQLHCHRIAF